MDTAMSHGEGDASMQDRPALEGFSAVPRPKCWRSGRWMRR
jgi:hypothetical protein